MQDWIQETCLISAVTSRQTEPKTFQEAWHYPTEKERNIWRAAIRKVTENVTKTLSKAPCLVAKRMSLTLHLLLFKQSM